MSISDTFRKRYNIPVLLLLREDDLYDACHLKNCCVNPVRKEVTLLFKRLGMMDMVVEKLRTFKELLFARFTS